MANPVAVYATSIDPPSRRPGAVDPDSYRGAARARAAYPRLAYDAGADPAFERLRHADAARAARPRFAGTDTARPHDRFLAAQDDAEFLRETGRRKASATISFLAQQIAQEELSPGAHFEPYRPAVAAYDRAGRHGDAALARGQTLQMLV